MTTRAERAQNARSEDRSPRWRSGIRRFGIMGHGFWCSFVEQYGFWMNEETRRLLDSLERQRSHVLGILEGLSEEQLRRPTLPSGWTALGMVKHLALDDEHYWFRCIVHGESLDFFPERSDEG